MTIPAGDLEIVLGKYLAAVAIYTVSLAISAVSNFVVLRQLGEPDLGLFLSNYLGYWFLGLAMLAIGMVASFLTRNITVAYILGAVLNALVVLSWYADMLPMLPYSWAMVAKQWSLGGQFQEFGRGIIGPSGVVFFVMIAAVMLYLCMVLIGRRHWNRSGSWFIMGSNFILRAAALGAIAIGLVYILYSHPTVFRHSIRLDATSERLSTLSPHTIEVLDDLHTNYQAAEIKRPVRIEAFVSTKVPEMYLQTRLNLLSTLRELKARAGNMMDVQINPVERASAVADLAKQRYGIEPRHVRNIVHGTDVPELVFLSVAVTCGLEKVVLPFIDRGTPIEYELVRAICTVEKQKRKRIGIVETDAPVFGRFSMQGQSPSWQIIDDLKKQYEVIPVSPSQPIPLRKAAAKPGDKEEGFDVLVVIQPSAMGPPECNNLIAAIRAGQPTVLFEDPFSFATNVPGTSQPRRPPDPQMAMFQPQQNLQKGSLKPLWKMLGISFSGSENSDEFQPMPGEEEMLGGSDEIVFQKYNPIPKLSFEPEIVFVNGACGGKGFDPFNEKDPISSGLQHLVFLAPGHIEKRNTSELADRDFQPLVRTGTKSGTLRASQMITHSMFGAQINPDRPHTLGQNTEYILAAHITGILRGAAPAADAGKDPKAKPAKAPDTNVNVVLVADFDMLTDEFFRIREQGEMPDRGINFDFDNVSFVLNAIDSLAGEDRFLELRKRRPKHRTLTKFDERLEEARKQEAEARDNLRKEKDDNIKKESAKFKEEIDKLRERLKTDTKIEQADVENRVATALQEGQKRIDDYKKDAEQKSGEKIDDINSKLDAKIQTMRAWFMFWAVVIPPIAPLALAGFVFIVRRTREREGVNKSRLR